MKDEPLQRPRQIAVIPARAGSKRVKGKNKKLFFGRPVIEYSIKAAIESNCFERVLVTTDDEEIRDVAIRCGADVPFLRAESLSDDVTPVSEATLDAVIRVMESGDQFDVVAQLMPNCPFRDESDVRASSRFFLENGSSAQISVMEYHWTNPFWAVELDSDHCLKPVFSDYIASRSQDLKKVYCPSGAIWWAKIDELKKNRTFHMENRTGWVINWLSGVDIDTAEDWDLAEKLWLAKGKKV